MIVKKITWSMLLALGLLLPIARCPFETPATGFII
jgi:hypothetical protein